MRGTSARPTTSVKESSDWATAANTGTYSNRPRDSTEIPIQCMVSKRSCMRRHLFEPRFGCVQGSRFCREGRESAITKRYPGDTHTVHATSARLHELS